MTLGAPSWETEGLMSFVTSQSHMAYADFVHLRVHTAYSLLEGAIRTGPLVELCREQRMPAVAITDTGNLFGALEFSEACAHAGVQPIIGSAIALDATPEERGASGLGRRPEPGRLVLLAQDEGGYRNLMALSSRSFLDTAPGETPRVTLDLLRARSAGLIALTGGPRGLLGMLLLASQTAAVEKLVTALQEIFRGRLYVELQRHGMDEERDTEPAFLDLAYARDLPLVATNEVYFGDASMYEAHDALLCIEQRTTVGVQDRRRLTPEHRFKSAAEMREVFADLPESIDNTLVIAQRCAYRPAPRAPILPAFQAARGRSTEDELRTLARDGLTTRLAAPENDAAGEEAPYWERLEFELGVILSMGYAGYFLIVADFIGFARASSIPVGPGRGSGAGSLVAWALGITDLDPLRFDLLFERFLNPDRVSMPDFDIDFCQDRRDEVIRYVQQKYGRDRVAQIITFGTLQARAALRDVGRVLELPYGQVDRICKMVPNNPANPVSLAQAIEGDARLRQERDEHPEIARMLEIASQLEGLYRHASTHAAGVVIGDRPIDDLVPLYLDPRSDMPATQFSMKYVEMAGLIKFDFLGLKTLTVLENVRRRLVARGVAVNFERLPLDDASTYKILQRGETVGVFQFESSGMRDLIREAAPTRIEDLIALVALYRPGPMENIPKYVACKHGREEPEFLHETIAPVVADTYGVIIYQEQVMRIAQVFAGFSLAQADLLRRAMGKKIKSEMAAQRESFVEGAVARDVPRDRAAQVFDLVDKFAGYGFNKAHSAGYALIAYQTAWLKANHPVEFMAATMSLDAGNADKLDVFRREVSRLGIELRPPDINRSGALFAAERAGEGGDGATEAHGAVRYGLAAIRNVGEQAMDAVVAEREANGPFVDLFDFARRIGSQVVNKRQLENLTQAGAFDSLCPNRAQVFGAVDLLLRHAGRNEEAARGQTNFFDAGMSEGRKPSLPKAEPWLPSETLSREFEAMGFWLSAHPLEAYTRTLDHLQVVTARALPERVNEKETRLRVAGMVQRVQERRSARGNRYAFVMLSDPTGQFEVRIFSELLESARELLEPGKAALLEVEAHMEADGPRLIVHGIKDLGAEAADSRAGLTIHLTGVDDLGRLKAALHRGGPGRGAVKASIRIDGAREVDIALPGLFAISPDVRETIARLAGVSRIDDT